MFALLLILLALCFCWLLYAGAIYALPCIAGLCAGQWAHETGAGLAGGAVLALITAITIFTMARAAFAGAASAIVRWFLAGCFVAPTLVVSYNIAIDALGGSVPSFAWRQLIAGGCALVAGAIALRRLTEEAREAE